MVTNDVIVVTNDAKRRKNISRPAAAQKASDRLNSGLMPERRSRQAEQQLVVVPRSTGRDSDEPTRVSTSIARRVPTPRSFRTALLAWAHGGNLRSFPWRNSHDAYAVLIAEFLLQRTPSWKVVPVWSQLMNRYPTAGQLAAADSREIEDLIRPLGLTKRWGTLKAIAAFVSKAGVPRTFKELTAIPGIGRYMAQALLTVLLIDRVAPADSVTARVYKRYFGLPGRQDNPDSAVAAVAEASMPRATTDAKLLNLAVLDLAAAVCKPVRPRCDQCPLRGSCASMGRQFERHSWRMGSQVSPTT